jgi:hypothetical protein
MKDEAWKAVHLLSGSIVKAILIDGRANKSGVIRP